MSKPVKNLIMKSYQRRFDGVDGVVLVDMRGTNANKNNEFRAMLAEKGMRVTIVKNTLAKHAAEGTPLEGIDKLLDGPCAFVYGGDSVVNVARELIGKKKEYETIEIKGAVMENTIFSAEQVEALSKYPTREEAIAKLTGALLGPGATLSAALAGPGKSLSAALKGPAGTVAALLKAIEAKQSEAA